MIAKRVVVMITLMKIKIITQTNDDNLTNE